MTLPCHEAIRPAAHVARGTRLAAQMRKPSGGWEVLVMDLVTGVRRRVDVEGNYRAFPAAWTPDSKTLMIGLWDPVQYLTLGATLYSLEQGTWETLPPFRGSYMSIAPMGGNFFFLSDGGWGSLIRPTAWRHHDDRVPARGFTALSPDGKWLAGGRTTAASAISPVRRWSIFRS